MNLIHTGNLDQEERSRAVDAFRQGIKDVLVATDVASKGLDFTNIQHVINYDMPDDIENYGNSKSAYSINIYFANTCLYDSASNRTYRSFFQQRTCDYVHQQVQRRISTAGS